MKYETKYDLTEQINLLAEENANLRELLGNAKTILESIVYNLDLMPTSQAGIMIKRIEEALGC